MNPLAGEGKIEGQLAFSVALGETGDHLFHDFQHLFRYEYRYFAVRIVFEIWLASVPAR